MKTVGPKAIPGGELATVAASTCSTLLRRSSSFLLILTNTVRFWRVTIRSLSVTVASCRLVPGITVSATTNTCSCSRVKLLCKNSGQHQSTMQPRPTKPCRSRHSNSRQLKQETLNMPVALCSRHFLLVERNSASCVISVVNEATGNADNNRFRLRNCRTATRNKRQGSRCILATWIRIDSRFGFRLTACW